VSAETVLWQGTEKQKEFLACPAREVLFAGSVGSGKTDAILMAGLSQVNNPKHRALLLRRTFPMLRDLIGRSHELFLPLGATFNKQESMWHFPSGAIVEFGFLDADEDKFRYMGRQFSMIGWDELTSWPGDGTDSQGQPVSSAYVYMLSRLRAAKDSNLRLEIRCTCTPGGVGHSWVKNRWNIPNDGRSSEVVDPATGYRRVFIRATIKDNPFLAGTDYERQLEALPEAQRKSLLLGRWDVFEGAIFSEFDPALHVVDGFQVPSEWKRWRAADDGFAAPFACLWLVWDKDVSDTIFVTKELYQRGLTPEAISALIKQLDGDERWSGVIDSSSFADTGFGARGDVMNRLGCKWTPVDKFPGSRLAGLSAIHQRLGKRNDGTVGLKVFRGCCPNLVRTLPALTYSTRNPEEVDPSCEDHAIDALRYGLLFRPSEARMVRLGGI
jgi:hypothetical protein